MCERRVVVDAFAVAWTLFALLAALYVALDLWPRAEHTGAAAAAFVYVVGAALVRRCHVPPTCARGCAHAFVQSTLAVFAAMNAYAWLVLESDAELACDAYVSVARDAAQHRLARTARAYAALSVGVAVAVGASFARFYSRHRNDYVRDDEPVREEAIEMRTIEHGQ